MGEKTAISVWRWPQLGLWLMGVGLVVAWVVMTDPLTAKERPSFEQLRDRMVQEQLKARGIEDERVLKAMRAVPRHRFVPERLRDQAYEDRPLPIGHDQTISQPYIVALMTELLQVEQGHKVLEVGTGSGYQAAVLRQITPHVHTIEIVKPLAVEAEKQLAREFGFEKGQVHYGDGYNGIPEEAPFDRIMVTAAPDEIPPPLLKQLKPGGRLVLPVGPVYAVQRLMVVKKDENGDIEKEKVLPVRFVPMTRKEESG